MWRSYLDCGYAELLTSGCDNRLKAVADGLNRYGCGVLPREEIAFGSCSCSTPTADATAAVEHLIAQLRSTHTPKWIVNQSIEGVRSTLRWHLRIPADVEIALTPSGTDAELLAVALADRNPDRPIFNLVVGAGEVGSGTIHAAAGIHYDNRVPRGNEVVAGEPVDRGFHSRIRAETVAVRDSQGRIRSPIDLDSEIQERVANAVDAGYQVLLHAVAHSKTGIFAPRLQTLDLLSRRLPDDVVVLVDAAQGRLGSTFGTVALGPLLERGWIIQFTGSKFFGGPPFSAALMVPSSLNVHQRGRGLPDSFGQYFSRSELPSSWNAIRRSMDSWINIPAILRWVAAAQEMDLFFAVPSHRRSTILEAFRSSAVRNLEETSLLEPMPLFNHAESDWAHLEGTFDTVFSFKAVHDGTPLNARQLRKLHQSLNSSSNGEAPIQLGQPVSIAPGHDVLRLALGAPMVRRVACDTRTEVDFEQRIEWMQQQVASVIRRIGHEVKRVAEVETSEHATLAPN